MRQIKVPQALLYQPYIRIMRATATCVRHTWMVGGTSRSLIALHDQAMVPWATYRHIVLKWPLLSDCATHARGRHKGQLSQRAGHPHTGHRDRCRLQQHGTQTGKTIVNRLSKSLGTASGHVHCLGVQPRSTRPTPADGAHLSTWATSPTSRTQSRQGPACSPWLPRDAQGRA